MTETDQPQPVNIVANERASTGVDAAIATPEPATDAELAALLRGEVLPRGRRVLVMQAALVRLESKMREIGAQPPGLASLVELVTGQQDQIDKLQAMLEPRIPAGVVNGRPVAGPERIALDGEIARAIDRHDLATRTHVDEAVRRLAATIRQYVRDQIQQALRRRPSVLRRVWDALADRGAPPSAPAGAPEPAAVPPAIAEMAEQALRRGR